MSPEGVKPPVAILKASGINCDQKTQYALEVAGAAPEVIHVNQLRHGEKQLSDYMMVVIPGGFSYGDDVASGRVMAIELKTQLADQLLEHTEQRHRLVLGICNGFQVLMQTGLLTEGTITSLDQIRATLTKNESGQFESRGVYVKAEPQSWPFPVPENPIYMPVAHGEGRFFATANTIRELETRDQVILRYCTKLGEATQEYPANPNGSLHAIAGIRNPSGTVFGWMPHEERVIQPWNTPNFRRGSVEVNSTHGLIWSIVDHIKQL